VHSAPTGSSGRLVLYSLQGPHEGAVNHQVFSSKWSSAGGRLETGAGAMNCRSFIIQLDEPERTGTPHERSPGGGAGEPALMEVMIR